MLESRLARDLLKGVPIFQGLRVEEMRLFLGICRLMTVPPGHVVCEFGGASHDFCILLEGNLKVLSRTGTELAELRPVVTVGEMGLITRRPRTATVKAAGPARLLEVGYPQFEGLLAAHGEMQARLYRNFVKVLADRLNDANDMIARYKQLLREASAEADGSAAPEPAGGAAAASAGPEAAGSGDAGPVHLFFELLQRLPNPEDLTEGEAAVAALREAGYSAADVEYAAKWTARNIPSARRFSMVSLSIQEALEDKWSI